MPQAQPAAAGRARAHAAGPPPGGRRADDAGRASARCCSAAAAVVTTSAWTRRRLLELYALPADRVHVAEPGVDAADLAPGTAAGGALLCVAAVTPDKGHDVLLDALATIDGPVRGTACAWAAWTATRRSSSGSAAARCDAGLGDRVRFAGTADRSRARRAATPPPTCWCWRRAPRPTAWSSPRRWPAACRSSPPTSAGCRRRSGTAPTGAGRGCSSRPATRRRSAPRCGPGSATPSCEARLRRAARERRESLAGWSTTTSVLAGVLAGASR